MPGILIAVVISESSEGLSELLAELTLPVPPDQTEPNVADLASIPFLAEEGLSGAGMITAINRIGALVSLELVVFGRLLDTLRSLSATSDRLIAKERLKNDLGERLPADERADLPEGMRAPRGGRIGDLLWHTGSSWERLHSQSGAVLVTSPAGEPVWLPLPDLVSRLELVSAAPGPSSSDLPARTGFPPRSERVETAAVSDLLSRLPLVWYSLGGAGQDERLRPAVLIPGSDERGEQRLVVFLSSEDTDWLRLSDGAPSIQRTGAEGRTPGTWRRI